MCIHGYHFKESYNNVFMTSVSTHMDRERSLSASVNVLCLAIISTVGDKLHKGVAKLAVKLEIKRNWILILVKTIYFYCILA